MARIRDACALLYWSVLWPLRSLLKWATTYVIAFGIIVVLVMGAMYAFKSAVCQIPLANVIIGFLGATCEVRMSSMGSVSLMTSMSRMTQKVCHVPGVKEILQKSGVQCHATVMNDNATQVDTIQVLLKSVNELPIVAEPTMDLYTMVQVLWDARLKLDDAGHKISVTSVPDSYQYAQDHYRLSDQMADQAFAVSNFLATTKSFIDWSGQYLRTVSSVIEKRESQPKLPWYDVVSIPPSNNELVTAINGYFKFTQEGLEELIDNGTTVLNMLMDGEKEWRRLQAWRNQKVEDIKIQIGKPMTWREWLHKVERTEHLRNGNLLDEVDETAYTPLRGKMSEILRILGTSVSSMDGAQRRIDREIKVGNALETSSSEELRKWSVAVKMLSEGMRELLMKENSRLRKGL